METIDQFKQRISQLPKDEIIKARGELFTLLDLAFKMRKVVGVGIYNDIFAKYMICVDLTV